MGGHSTSQTALSSDKKDSISAALDMHSWQGLTEVLKVGKEYLRDPVAYAEFRNLVLEYAQKGGDVALRKKIDLIVSRFSDVVVKEKEKDIKKEEKSEEDSSHTKHQLHHRRSRHSEREIVRTPQRVGSLVATRRIQPRFKRPVSEVVEEDQVEKEPELPEEKKVSPIEDSKSAPEEKVVSNEPVVDAKITPSDNSSVAEVDAPPPVVNPQEVPQQEVVQDRVEVPVQTFRSLDEHKARIATIKRSVHAHIGNPATLIDTHNDVGRKYMSALLLALKATGAGSEEGIDSAMVRLEEAYDALIHDVPAKDIPKPPVSVPVRVDTVPTTPIDLSTISSQGVVVPEPIDELPKQEVSPVVLREEVPEPPNEIISESPVIADDSDVLENTLPDNVPLPAEVVSQPSSEQIDTLPDPEALEEEVIKPKENIPQPKVTLLPSFEQDIEQPEPVRSEEIPTVTPKLSGRGLDEIRALLQKKKSAPVPPTPTPTHTPLPAVTESSSVNEMMVDPEVEQKEEIRVETPEISGYDLNETRRETSPDVKTESSQVKHVRKGVAATPIDLVQKLTGVDTNNLEVQSAELNTIEITEALHDLLHEWSLFEGSGFFGIGPGGSEHPLYLKLAQLSMGEVLSGRYEGSTPKIRKTLKEYIDAWHHEQGVAYVATETFEHYLRRVVQRILKRQRS